VMLEASRLEPALRHAQALAAAAGVPDSEVYTFQLLWRLGS
jgi:hypothetical protein